jgi:hypothetical protein
MTIMRLTYLKQIRPCEGCDDFPGFNSSKDICAMHGNAHYQEFECVEMMEMTERERDKGRGGEGHLLEVIDADYRLSADKQKKQQKQKQSKNKIFKGARKRKTSKKSGVELRNTRKIVESLSGSASESGSGMNHHLYRVKLEVSSQTVYDLTTGSGDSRGKGDMFFYFHHYQTPSGPQNKNVLEQDNDATDVQQGGCLKDIWKWKSSGFIKETCDDCHTMLSKHWDHFQCESCHFSER